MNDCKRYVDVVVRVTHDGRLIPLSIMWADGHVYDIQKVTEVRRAASLKAGGVGTRYTCMIDGRCSHIFFEDNNRWFVETR